MIRPVLTGAALLTLAACAHPVTAPSVQASAAQLASDVQLIDNGLSAVLPSVARVANVPPATVARINADLAKIQADAAQVQADVTATSAVPTGVVQEIASVVTDVATVVLPAVPGAAPFVPVVQAANALVPVLLNAIGSPAAGAAPVMSPSAARLVLAGAAAR